MLLSPPDGNREPARHRRLGTSLAAMAPVELYRIIAADGFHEFQMNLSAASAD
jgi:hypothetical protein